MGRPPLQSVERWSLDGRTLDEPARVENVPMTSTVDLEPMVEDWQRALAVVAHPDDMEYGAAAAVARWTGQGKWVGYVLVTDGEAGIESMPPEAVGPLRRDEQIAGCREVGVADVEFLGLPDGLVVEGLELRSLLTGV